MVKSTDRSLSLPLVISTVIALLVGLALGVLILVQPPPPPIKHRPDENAILPHLIIGVLVFAYAAIATVATRSVRWIWWPLSAQTGQRISTTFRHARGSFTGLLRCIAFVILATVVLYLTLRMGMQATAGISPGFSTNAWGGPSALGAFAAHGVDAILFISVSSMLAHLVLNRPDV